MENKKRVLSVVLPILILAFGIGGMKILEKFKKEAAVHPPREKGALVEVIRVRKKDHQVIISATGTVRAFRKVAIVPQVSGKVVWISPKLVAGGIFEPGEKMFQIERDDYEIALQEAEAQVSAALQELETIKGKALVARRQWVRLHGEDKSPPSPLVFYEPQLQAARAALDAAYAAKDKAELDLRRTTLRAPFSCIVSEEEIEQGSYVKKDSPVATVLGTERAEVVVPVPLKDMQWLDIPAQATVSVAVGGGNYTWKGKATRILPDVDELGRMPRIVVEVPDPFQRKTRVPGRPDLVQGIFAEVSIKGLTARNVFRIPRATLRRGETVWIAGDDEKLKIKRIQVIRAEKDTVLVRGLQEGERLITTNMDNAAPGMRIRVVERNGLK